MTSVLVGIPTLNGPDRLQRCLDSIVQCTRFNEFDMTVLVCDDGSETSELERNKQVVYNSGIPGLEMLMNGERLGIAASWNRLVRHRYADVVVLLNDDIEVVDHWLDVLVYSVTRNSSAGMVALNSYVGVTKAQALLGGEPLRIDYCEGRLQDGGGKLLTSNGSIFAFRREAYDLVNGFDERYFCFYEEVDFGVALRKQGLFHLVSEYPIVYHMGGATNSEERNLIASEEMARSRQKFREKWGGSPEELRSIKAPPAKWNEWNTQLIRLKD